MTTDHTPEEPRTYRSLSYQAIQTLGLAFPLILRAAMLPFLLSVGVVVLARLVGAPERYALDGLHGVFVILYLTAVARIAMGTYPGTSFLGLSIPRPVWPGVKPVLGMLAEAALLMIPTALLMLILAPYVSGVMFGVESLILDVVGHILPEFILNTLLGLVIGAGVAKIRAEQA